MKTHKKQLIMIQAKILKRVSIDPLQVVSMVLLLMIAALLMLFILLVVPF